MNQKISQKVVIIPGIVSGKHTTTRLRRALQHAGYTVVSCIADADIIMAHSAGCLWMSQASPNQWVVLVNPPYWPGKTIRDRVRSRGRTNFLFWRYGYPFHRWLIRNLWGVYYAVRSPRRNQYIIRNMDTFDLEQSIRGHRVLLVRNEHDDWLTPDLDKLQRDNPSLQIVRLPSDHDDFNYTPERYVHLLQSLT